MFGIRNTAIITACLALGANAVKPEISAAGGTLAIFIPTQSGLVIAADMRQSPKGIFCDGINKILIPKRPAHTAVVVTGFVTLSDTSNISPDQLCAHLANNPAPINFGRSAVEFLELQNVPIEEFNGNALADKIYAEIQPYLVAGHLRPLIGTRVAQMIFAQFDPATKTSKIRVLAVDMVGAAQFQLQPVQVTTATTLRGDRFGPESNQTVLPFGEVPYFREQVLAGPGRAFIGHEYLQLVGKLKVSDVDPALAGHVAINLIDATAKTTEKIPAPSGIGGLGVE